MKMKKLYSVLFFILFLSCSLFADSPVYRQMITDGMPEWRWVEKVRSITYDYDINDRIAHCKDSSGYERWFEYDADGVLTYIRDSDGDEEWFDSFGVKVIHWKYANGTDHWSEFDSQGNRIYKSDYSGEYWYDINGNVIRHKSSGRYEEFYEYDRKGNRVRTIDSDDCQVLFEYYDNGIPRYSNDGDYEYWYNQSGKEMRIRDIDSGSEEIYLYLADIYWLETFTTDDDISVKYDDNGMAIYVEDNGLEYWMEYDKDGRLLSVRTSHNDALICDSFDETGRPNHYYFSGFELWAEYYNNGMTKSVRNSYGESIMHDQKGREIYRSASNRETWTVYGEDGEDYECYFSSHGDRCEFDENGNVIYIMADGQERWYDYYSNGRIRHIKDSDGEEKWYNEKGTLIHELSSYQESWCDEFGNLIHCKRASGDEYWNEYDKDGELVYQKYYSYKSDSIFFQGSRISIKLPGTEFMNYMDEEETSAHSSSWNCLEFDEKGNITHIFNDQYDEWFEYDRSGHLLHQYTSSGFEMKCEYDNQGNIVHIKYVYGDDYDEGWIEYTGKYNQIHTVTFYESI